MPSASVGAADRPVLAVDGVVEGGIERGLDADDLDRWLERLRRDRDAGDQSAAADRDDDLVEVRRVGQHLERDGALAGHDGGIVVGMDEGEAFLCARSPAPARPNSDRVSPCKTTRAPWARVFSAFTSGVPTGITMVAGMPRRLAW